jgi:uncharacterized damage-inducible protein DinB
MPVASQITNAAVSYRQNAQILERSIAGLSAAEWRNRPNDHSNALLWIVGHIVWARSRSLQFLGSTWTRPWLPLFARGAKLVDQPEYPSPDEIVLAWKHVAACLTAALEAADEEKLSAPAPEKSPSFDGKIGGLVSFFAFHETYHVGQVAYLRCWLGHDPVLG